MRQETTPTLEEPYPGGRQIIREALTKQGIPPESLDIMISSINDSTKNNYDTAFRKWWRFCHRNLYEIFDPSINIIIQFLTEEFEKGLAYSTINCIRSAISLIVKVNVTEDCQVKRFLRAFLN